MKKKVVKDKRTTNGGYRPGSGPKKKSDDDKKTTINFSVLRSLVNTPEKRKALKDFVYSKMEEYKKSPLSPEELKGQNELKGNNIVDSVKLKREVVKKIIK